MSLDYKRGSYLHFVADEVDIEKAMGFMKRFREKYSNLKLMPLYYFPKFKSDHNKEPEKAIEDLIDWLRIIDEGKKMGVRVVPRAPWRAASPFWFYFEELEAWTTHRPKESMVEWFCGSAQTYHNALLPVVFYDTLKWSTPQIQWLMDIARKYPDIIKEFGYRR